MAGSNVMRRFVGEDGREWEVTIGKESWGTLVLLFSPLGSGDVRKAVIAAETSLAAHAELDAMTDEMLRTQLERASPW
jgi:hypothetical protein